MLVERIRKNQTNERQNSGKKMQLRYRKDPSSIRLAVPSTQNVQTNMRQKPSRSLSPLAMSVHPLLKLNLNKFFPLSSTSVQRKRMSTVSTNMALLPTITSPKINSNNRPRTAQSVVPKTRPSSRAVTTTAATIQQQNSHINGLSIVGSLNSKIVSPIKVAKTRKRRNMERRIGITDPMSKYGISSSPNSRMRGQLNRSPSPMRDSPSQDRFVVRPSSPGGFDQYNKINRNSPSTQQYPSSRRLSSSQNVTPINTNRRTSVSKRSSIHTGSQRRNSRFMNTRTRRGSTRNSMRNSMTLSKKDRNVLTVEGEPTIEDATDVETRTRRRTSLAASVSAATIRHITGFISRMGLQMFLENKRPLAKPNCRKTEAAVLFCDISGFTKLTEQLASLGPDIGAEKLTKVLNNFYERLLGIVHSHCGDVAQFSGDAVLVMFHEAEDLSLAIIQCALCASAVRDAFEDYREESEESVQFRVHQGIGIGDVTMMHVGGVFDRWEGVVTGPPMAQITSVCDECSAGEVVCSKEAWEHLKGIFEGKTLISGNVLLVDEMPKAIPSSLRMRLMGETVEKKFGNIPERFDEAASDDNSKLIAAKKCVPGAVLSQLISGHTREQINEKRNLSVIFCNVDLNIQSPLQLPDVQNVFHSAQKTLYRYEGSVNKFVVDDKGCTLIAAFGLPPLLHEDDPMRALQCSIDLRQIITKLGFKCFLGVSTGPVFCCILGSRDRFEYTVMGDKVNIAARLMQASMKGPGILCDAMTASRCTGAPLKAMAPLKVKGKELPLEVFVPTGSPSGTNNEQTNEPDTDVENEQQIANEAELMMDDEKLAADNSIEVRPNEKRLLRSLLRSFGTKEQRKRGLHIEVLGIDEGPLNEVLKNVKPEYHKQIDKLRRGGLLMIESDPGMGKSAIMRYARACAIKLGLNVISTNADSMHKRSLYFVWRIIFQSILGLSQMSATDIKDIILESVEPRYFGMLSLIQPLLPVENVFPKSKQVSSMTTAEKITATIKITLSLLLPKLRNGGTRCVFIEDCHWMDDTSWEMLLGVASALEGNMMIIGSCRTVPRRNASNSAQTNLRGYGTDVSKFMSKLENVSTCGFLKLAPLVVSDLCDIIRCSFALRSAPFPEMLMEVLGKKARGNPFLASALIESMIRTNMAWKTPKDTLEVAENFEADDVEFPPEVKALVTSQLDRLESREQLIIKLGSVLGTSFTLEMLVVLYKSTKNVDNWHKNNDDEEEEGTDTDPVANNHEAPTNAPKSPLGPITVKRMSSNQLSARPGSAFGRRMSLRSCSSVYAMDPNAAKDMSFLKGVQQVLDQLVSAGFLKKCEKKPVQSSVRPITPSSSRGALLAPSPLRKSMISVDSGDNASIDMDIAGLDIDEVESESDDDDVPMSIQSPRPPQLFKSGSRRRRSSITTFQPGSPTHVRPPTFQSSSSTRHFPSRRLSAEFSKDTAPNTALPGRLDSARAERLSAQNSTRMQRDSSGSSGGRLFKTQSLYGGGMSTTGHQRLPGIRPTRLTRRRSQLRNSITSEFGQIDIECDTDSVSSSTPRHGNHNHVDEAQVYEFESHLVQDVAYSLMGFEHRQHLHKLAARFLKNKHIEDEDDGEVSHHLARHFLKAHDWVNSMTWLQKSAEHANKTHQLHRAVRNFKKLLRLFVWYHGQDKDSPLRGTPSGNRCSFGAGNPRVEHSRWLGFVRRIVQSPLEEEAELRKVGRWLMQLAVAHLNLGQFGIARRRLLTAIVLLDKPYPGNPKQAKLALVGEAIRMRILSRRQNNFVVVNDDEEDSDVDDFQNVDFNASILAESKSSIASSIAEAYDVASRIEYFNGNHDARAFASLRCLNVLTEAKVFGPLRCRALASCALICADFKADVKSDSLLAEAARLTPLHGDVKTRIFVPLMSGLCRIQRGQLTIALSSFETGSEIARSDSDERRWEECEHMRAQIFSVFGDCKSALSAFKRAAESAKSRSDFQMYAKLTLGSALVLLLQNDFENTDRLSSDIQRLLDQAVLKEDPAIRVVLSSVMLLSRYEALTVGLLIVPDLVRAAVKSTNAIRTPTQIALLLPYVFNVITIFALYQSTNFADNKMRQYFGMSLDSLELFAGKFAVGEPYFQLGKALKFFSCGQIKQCEESISKARQGAAYMEVPLLSALCGLYECKFGPPTQENRLKLSSVQKQFNEMGARFFSKQAAYLLARKFDPSMLARRSSTIIGARGPIGTLGRINLGAPVNPQVVADQVLKGNGVSPRKLSLQIL